MFSPGPVRWLVGLFVSRIIKKKLLTTNFFFFKKSGTALSEYKRELLCPNRGMHSHVFSFVQLYTCKSNHIPIALNCRPTLQMSGCLKAKMVTLGNITCEKA